MKSYLIIYALIICCVTLCDWKDKNGLCMKCPEFSRSIDGSCYCGEGSEFLGTYPGYCICESGYFDYDTQRCGKLCNDSEYLHCGECYKCPTVSTEYGCHCMNGFWNYTECVCDKDYHNVDGICKHCQGYVISGKCECGSDSYYDRKTGKCKCYGSNSYYSYEDKECKCLDGMRMISGSCSCGYDRIFYKGKCTSHIFEDNTFLILTVSLTIIFVIFFAYKMKKHGFEY